MRGPIDTSPDNYEVENPRAIRIGGAVVGAALALSIEILWREAAPPERHAAAVAVVMVCSWLAQTLPIHWTALIPLAAFPLLHVFVHAPERPTRLLRAVLPEDRGFVHQLLRTVDGYLDANTFLFLGGMMVAAAMERWRLHRRVALSIMAAVGSSPGRLLLGCLLATAFVSMWISNTATAVMMMPIGLAIVRQLEAEEERRLSHFGLAMMLAVAYGANLGGISTKIGTAPNAIFCAAAEKIGTTVDFARFLLIGFPFALMMLPVAFALLWRAARREGLTRDRGHDVVAEERRRLGPMSRQEWLVAIVFGAAAMLWICGQPLSRLLGLRGAQMDALTAMAAATVLLATRTIDLAALRAIPYRVLILLSGSFAMAEGIAASGLLERMSVAVQDLTHWPAVPTFLVVALATTALSAAASNTAITTLMMSVLAPFGAPLMATSAIAASCDFMLPAGTPPNAIVFGSGYVTIPKMVRVGGVLDLCAAVLAGLWGVLGVRALL
jgi:sodium-dependent dicarboxylate transporter 2/3/5